MISMRKTWEEAVTEGSLQWLVVAGLEWWQMKWQKWMVWGCILAIVSTGLVVELDLNKAKARNRGVKGIFPEKVDKQKYRLQST